MRPSLPPEYPDARPAAFTWMARHIDDQAGIARVAELFYRGDFAEVLRLTEGT